MSHIDEENYISRALDALREAREEMRENPRDSLDDATKTIRVRLVTLCLRVYEEFGDE